MCQIIRLDKQDLFQYSLALRVARMGGGKIVFNGAYPLMGVSSFVNRWIKIVDVSDGKTPLP